jgi:hypothetical protein
VTGSHGLDTSLQQEAARRGPMESRRGGFVRRRTTSAAYPLNGITSLGLVLRS